MPQLLHWCRPTAPNSRATPSSPRKPTKRCHWLPNSSLAVATWSSLPPRAASKCAPTVGSSPSETTSLSSSPTVGIIEYFRVSKVGPRYYIEVPMLMLSFRYTGDEIVNIIPSTHRAQHCGMCGNYNGQVFDELVGPSGCAMKDASDMAKSYVLRDKTCEQSTPVPSCKASYDSRRTSSGIVAFLDQFSEMKH